MHRRRPASILLVAAIAAITLLVAGAPSAGAATRDPVLRAIDSATSAKAITRVQRSRLRATWLQSARAARNARAGSRRSNIIAVRAYVSNLARRGQLRADRLEAALLSVKATTYVMTKSRTFPAHEAELRVPGEIVVFTYYSGRGVQYQPFESFKLGMRYLNSLEPDVAKARALADRMLELSQVRGTSRIWEYFFVFGGPSTPWTSAISQALGTEFFYRLAALVPEAERAPYDDAARRMTNSFLRSTRAGGVSTPEGSGRFYTMYNFNPGQRILNGHLQVLINLNRYATATGSVAARRVVDLGLAAVLPLMPKFDTGAWSRYQLGQEANLNYHQFMTDQLVKLGKELKDPTLQDYADRFETYLVTPPQVTVPATSWPTIIPARDGFRDSIAIRYRVDKRARTTMIIEDADGNEVRRLSAYAGGGVLGTLRWDGRNAKGAVVPDGSYSARLTITDVVGNRAYGSLTGSLDVARDTEAPTLRTLSLSPRAGGKSTMVLRVSDTGSAWVTAQVKLGRRVVATKRGPRAGRIVLVIDRTPAQLRSATVVLVDSSGNRLLNPLAGG